jgi:hypothetical protein
MQEELMERGISVAMLSMFVFGKSEKSSLFTAHLISPSSRLRLHIHNLKHTKSREAQESRQRSLIGLHMIARLGSQSKDAAQSLGNNDEFMKEENMPPFSLNAGRDIALVCIDLLKNPVQGVGDDQFWRETLAFYKASFQIGRRKWKLADECASIVTKSEEEPNRQR